MNPDDTFITKCNHLFKVVLKGVIMWLINVRLFCCMQLHRNSSLCLRTFHDTKAISYSLYSSDIE